MTVVIMSSQPTVVAQPVVVHMLCGWCGDMLWEAHWLVVQHNSAKYKYKKYCTIYNTDTVAYATHSGSYSNECKKEVHYTLVRTWYTTITAVYNIHSGEQHIYVICSLYINKPISSTSLRQM